MRRRKVAVLGATGTVGQRFIGLLAAHPWFEIAALTTSDAKAGKRYGDVTPWHSPGEMPAGVADMTLQPTKADLDAEVCFSALPSEAAELWEAALAKTGHHVFSNVKTHRMDDDVPLMIAEVNPEHMHALEVQRRKRSWTGSLVTNGNCSAIGFALAVAPLHKTFGIERAVVTTMQALSGAGYPGVASLDAFDNVVPFIGEEEEKMKVETRKFLGTWDGKRFVDADFLFSAHCNRVPVRDGHTEAVSIALRGSPPVDAVKDAMRSFRGRPQELRLPTAPERPIHVRDERDRPQPILDRDTERGMAATVGRVREDPVLGMKFVVLTHNTIRGAAGASVLNAELLAAEGCLGN
ncbi:MAG TPA: aspartate-semialdehyde dehydrogenase [Candidatus Limnocylindria bacterium]|jgi:aspartate-semialdehyde dehydrogenase|nr:aspartate-semialdehyde dehydrogenase [Candidatus Limnocylindria bacterium]